MDNGSIRTETETHKLKPREEDELFVEYIMPSMMIKNGQNPNTRSSEQKLKMCKR